jgi:hypothetical protein
MKSYQRLFIFTLLALVMTVLLSPRAAAAWAHLIAGRADWQHYVYSFSRIFSRFFMISGIALFIVLMTSRDVLLAALSQIEKS